MELLYRLLANFLMGVFILAFYSKIIELKIESIGAKFSIACSALGFATYMAIAYFILEEPFRAVSGTLILSFAIWLMFRNVIMAALLLAVFTGYIAGWLSVLLGNAVNVIVLQAILNLELGNIFLFLLLLLEVIAYVCTYKIFVLREGIKSINAHEVKAIVFALTGIILAFFGVVHLSSTDLHDTNTPLFTAFIIILSIVVLAAIYYVIIFTKRYRERLALQEKQKELTMENARLDKNFKSVFDKNHKYGELMMVMAVVNTDLLEELDDIVKSGNSARIDKFKSAIIQAMKLHADVDEEITFNNIIDSYQGIGIPDTWRALKTRVVLALEECNDKDYYGYAHSDATWEHVPVKQGKLVQYVSNLLRNAITALDNTDTLEKQLNIYFTDEDKIFSFTIADTAHDFPIEILTNLGQRGNTTSGNGNGFMEIFEFIADTSASLIITEYIDEGTKIKSIKTVFDGNERIVIRSSFRYEELKQAISDARIEVVEYE